MRRLTGIGAVLAVMLGAYGAARAERPARDVVWLPFDNVAHGVSLAYAAEVVATTTNAGETTGQASVSLGITARTTFDRRGHSAFQILAAASATGHQLAGSHEQGGVATHLELALGPRLSDGDVTDPDVYAFPVGFETVHDGELMAMPRLSARPDLGRSAYTWQRLELALWFGRPMAMPLCDCDGEPSSLQLLMLKMAPFRAAAEVTEQDGRRVDASVGVDLVGATFEDAGGTTDVRLLGVELASHGVPDQPSLGTVTAWAGRIERSNMHTGTRYRFALGLMNGEDLQLGPGDDGIVVASAGWWRDFLWGSLGWQYRREPYVTMAGDLAVEDRWSLEVFRAGGVDLRGQAFVARPHRRIDGAWQTDTSGGVALDAHRRLGGVDVTLSGEIGRSFYGALDGAAPTPGLATRATLTIRAAGESAWSW